MAGSLLTRRSFLAVPPLAVAMLSSPLRAEGATYFPAAGQWKRKSPAEAGLDAAKLQQAVEFAKANGSVWNFERDQVPAFGPVLGRLPKQHAVTNGIILRHGYIVAEFGDTKAVDPVYSMAKSIMSTAGGIAVTKGLIKDVNDPVAKYIHDGGYDSPHNAKITWRHHLEQTSEWEGTLWDRNADFVGADKFGAAAQPPRPIQEPGSHYEYNDVRMNRFGLSLLRLFGKGLPDVLKESVMDPIGASNTWQWLGYDNSYVEIGGKKVQSVTGGTRWGGGFWTNSEDIARLGLLVINHGRWDGRQLVSEQFLNDATKPSKHGPDYGYLWWLNTTKKSWPQAPATSFAARGHGSNIIWIDREHDIVMIWRWARNEAMAGMTQRLVESVVA